MVTTTLHQAGDRARLVPSNAIPTTGSWRDRSTASTFLGSTGLVMFATAGYGIGDTRANCPVDAAKRTTTRPSRHLATGST